MSVYLQARIQLRWGASAEFHELMAQLVPLVERTGWRLLGSWQQITGDMHEVLDLWEVPDANAVPATLGALALEPAAGEIVAGLRDVILREELYVCTKTPFSP